MTGKKEPAAAAVTAQAIAFSGTVTVDGVKYPGSSGSIVLGAPATPVPVPVPVPVHVPTPVPSPSASACYFGVWDDGSSYPSTSYAGVQKFAAAPVKSATQYLAWLGPFPAAFNTLCAQNGATMYLNLEPWNTWGGGANPAMADIAAGKYDSYLSATIGGAIKAGGHPVWLTFAHEMNGNGWYPWQQSGGVTPAQWIAAWNHVVTTVKAAAGGLASFVWCPNNNDVGPVTPYWPGSVDIPGMDAYLNTASASQTFASFVEPTVAEIATLTSLPVWNAETGVAGTNRSTRISQFVSDMRADGRVRGLTWFNEALWLLQPTELQALTAAVNAWNAS
jgi:hypothetical protein